MILLFDCDGVVLDSMGLHTEVEAEVYRSLGVDITPEQLVQRFSGVSQSEVSRILSEESGVFIPAMLDDAIEAQKEIVFTQRLKPITGMAETLDALGDMPRCIASGTGLKSLQHMLTVTNLYDRFAPHVYSAEQVERGKPFPDLFLFAAQQLGATAETAIVIEDGVAGVKAGKAAGMRVLGFIGGSHCGRGHGRALLDAGADILFDQMPELPAILKEVA